MTSKFQELRQSAHRLVLASAFAVAALAPITGQEAEAYDTGIDVIIGDYIFDLFSCVNGFGGVVCNY